jgi:hypothetical protein
MPYFRDAFAYFSNIELSSLASAFVDLPKIRFIIVGKLLIPLLLFNIEMVAKKVRALPMMQNSRSDPAHRVDGRTSNEIRPYL